MSKKYTYPACEVRGDSKTFTITTVANTAGSLVFPQTTKSIVLINDSAAGDVYVAFDTDVIPTGVGGNANNGFCIRPYSTLQLNIQAERLNYWTGGVNNLRVLAIW